MEGPAVSLPVLTQTRKGWADFGYRPYGPGSDLQFIAGSHALSGLGLLLTVPVRQTQGQALRSSLDAIGTYEAPCSPGPEMLSGGVLPLDLLDARTDSWIKAQKAGAPPSKLKLYQQVAGINKV